MSVREEFEKAFEKEFFDIDEVTKLEWRCAIWAAKWFGERCATYLENTGSVQAPFEIRQLIKELGDN